MAEYIEREALLAEMRVSSKAAYLVVMDAPAADVAPVVRGRWDLLDDASSKIVKWNCDKCNRISTSKTDYCPNCGARMGGGDDG